MSAFAALSSGGFSHSAPKYPLLEDLVAEVHDLQKERQYVSVSDDDRSGIECQSNWANDFQR